jgi:hypothetical protein
VPSHGTIPELPHVAKLFAALRKSNYRIRLNGVLNRCCAGRTRIEIAAAPIRGDWSLRCFPIFTAHPLHGATPYDNAALRRIVSQRLILLRSWPRPLGHQMQKGGEDMRLLLVFLASLLVGQSISIGVGLLVERHATPYTGLVTFIVCYFAMFWVAWRFAVRVTEPRAHVRERGEPSAVLLGAYAAADDLWSQSSSLL